MARRHLLVAGLALTSLIFVACGGGTPPPTPPAPPTAQAPAPIKPDPETWPSKATVDLVVAGGLKVDVPQVWLLEFPEGDRTVNRVAFVVRAEGDAGQAAAVEWYEKAGPILIDHNGNPCRRVTTAGLVQMMKPKNGQCVLMFDVPPDAPAVYLMLPVPGVDGELIRFKAPRSVWRNFGSSATPDQLKPTSTQPTSAKTQPKKPSTPPEPTATHTLQATKAKPVAMATRADYLTGYTSAPDSTAAKKMIADENVVVVSEPLAVAVEGDPVKGVAYLRPTEGPHKGKLFVALATSLVKK